MRAEILIYFFSTDISPTPRTAPEIQLVLNKYMLGKNGLFQAPNKICLYYAMRQFERSLKNEDHWKISGKPSETICVRKKCWKIYLFLRDSINEGHILRSLREWGLGMKNFSAYILFLPELPNIDLKIILIRISLIFLTTIQCKLLETSEYISLFSRKDSVVAQLNSCPI